MKSDSFKIRPVDPDKSLVRRISLKRKHIKTRHIVAMLQQNVLTSSQLASLTGKRTDAIVTMAKVSLKDGMKVSKLTKVSAFNYVDENGDVQEPKKNVFILMDEKCRQFLIDNN